MTGKICFCFKKKHKESVQEVEFWKPQGGYILER